MRHASADHEAGVNLTLANWRAVMAPPNITAPQRAELLSIVNESRHRHSAPPLELDEELVAAHEADPTMHVFHYAPYEPTALKRLMGRYGTREDEVDVSPWLGMPGHKNLGIGRHWHGVTNSLWLLTGIVYVVLLFGTGEWRRLIPTSWDVVPRAWHSLTTYLSLQVPPLSEFQPYDALQQLTYAFVVFVLAPVMLVTGAAMSPAIAASFPWYIRLLGGRQVARSIHFLGMLAFTIFVVFHVLFVLVVHPRENLTNITLGGQPERLGLALAIDYTLLIVSRFRDELAGGAGREGLAAVRILAADRPGLHPAPKPLHG